MLFIIHIELSLLFFRYPFNYGDGPPNSLGSISRMKDGGSPSLSPSPSGIGGLTLGSSPNGSRGSLASIGTVSTHDELFRSPKHAESALKRM